MKKSLLLLPVALLMAALALSACGGGGSSSSGSGDEAAIETAIQSDATSTKPSKCTEFVTVKFNESQTGVSGAKATKACEEEVEEFEEPAESVDVSEINVEGETATAEAEVHGSSLNSQKVEIELVKESGEWKLNQFLAFTKFDAKALGEGLETGLENQGGLEPTTIKCLSEGVSGLSQAEAEEVAFEANLGPLEELGCE